MTALCPEENLIMVLEPKYLMLSLWLFFLLIEAFTKMTFSLSSTYGPGLPNDVFVPGRAWNLFVLTAVPREGSWAPPCGSTWGAEVINPKPKAEAWGELEEGPVCAKPGDPRTEERPRRDAVTSRVQFSFKPQPCFPGPAAGTFSPEKIKMIVRVIMAETDQRHL